MDVDGKPLTHMLAQEFGYGFIFSYVFSYMLVALHSDHAMGDFQNSGACARLR